MFREEKIKKKKRKAAKATLSFAMDDEEGDGELDPKGKERENDAEDGTSVIFKPGGYVSNVFVLIRLVSRRLCKRTR